MQIEWLEDRRLFAAAAAVLGADGTLTVTGTTADDRITVAASRDGSTVSVVAAVRGERGSRTKTDFTASSVKKIVIDGGDGDDTIRLGRGVSVTAAITGGAGDDYLNGGRGNDTIDGGTGDDYIVGNEGNDTLTGGDDDDFIDGGRGDDTISGNAGDDRLLGGDGNDKVSGGDDDDAITGGFDDDTLTGDAGNDRLFAADFGGTDTVDGGTNNTPTTDEPGDSAVADDNDTVTNVEDDQSDSLNDRPVFGHRRFGGFFRGGRLGFIGWFFGRHHNDGGSNASTVSIGNSSISIKL